MSGENGTLWLSLVKQGRVPGLFRTRLNTVGDPDSLRVKEGYIKVLEQSLRVPLPLLLLPGVQSNLCGRAHQSLILQKSVIPQPQTPGREKGGRAGARNAAARRRGWRDAEGGGAPPGGRDARRRSRCRCCRRRVSSVPHVPVFTSLVEPQTSQPNGNIVATLRLAL
jgi:hypothetical protein